MLEVGSLAIRNGMEYSHSGCVCFFVSGKLRDGLCKGIRGLTEDPSFLLLLAGFVVWMAHLQYSTQWSSGWIDRQNRQTERQTWPVISVD